MNAERGQRNAERGDITNLARSASSDVLLGFLRERRWFGAKASAVGARVRDVVALPWAEGRFVVARVEVQLEGGVTQTYQVPLHSHEGALADAAGDPDFLRHLANDLARGGAYEGDAGVRWIVAPEGEQGLVVPPNARIRVGSAEQSNTSIVFADEGMLKLFRKLEPGDHPDVELTRYLTVDAGFAYTPTLLGTIRFEEPGGVTVMAGMLQEYLLGSTDAWGYALEVGRREAGGGGRFGDFSRDAGKLGRITREMHGCLAKATGTLAPERATAADVREWADGARQWMNDAMQLLERTATRLPPAASREAEVLVRRRDDYLGFIDEIVEEVGDDAGLRTRIHGDYHLGQVLRTASDDFMIIDFEGEPARPLAERRRKASPMRDVAGMLRSFAYAAATLAREAGGGRREADPQVEIASARWERDTRAAFLGRYFSDETPVERTASRLPPTASRLLRLFEAEKVFYELAYELNNRPDWAWIPMRGISKLLVDA